MMYNEHSLSATSVYFTQGLRFETNTSEIRSRLSDYEISPFLRPIDSHSAAKEFPDKHILIAVNEKHRGVCYGKLLHVADSVADLTRFAVFNGYENDYLCYTTGNNLD